jgi:thiosulfate reductase cytochrome b subunit
MANNNMPSKYWRFNTWSRIEHGLLILSFTTLVITGIPQRYADSFLGNGAIQLLGGIETTRLIHHVAAAILVFESIYHLGRVSYMFY